MDVEPSRELRRRAALHAALSDPARLAIVDTLAFGDASPSELQQALGMASPGVRRARRVLFVCTAASARSQLAASLWRRTSRVPTASAGTHPADRIDPGAVDAARRHALPLRRVRPQHLDRVHLDGDFVVTVCDRAHEELGRLPDLHWSIPDPVRAGRAGAFDAAVDELHRRVFALAPRLVPA
jgi:ArsR family transcriptional regulator, arsenate/arsenite/antimonite-responsive transcriptional repressor / arsenate reductase (thioredoxin)